MTKVVVGKWGKNLAIRVPLELARQCGLVDGEPVEIEEVEGDLVIRRKEFDARMRLDARAAAEEIRQAARNQTLGSITIRELRDEGLRG